MSESLNKFGGFWTQQKIQVFIKYLKAYLDIMNKYNFKLIYFDGFAGSGTIENESMGSLIEGVAVQVLSLDHSKKFDIYYLVDLNKDKIKNLSEVINQKFPGRKGVFPVAGDCNKKIIAMADFMRKKENWDYRSLAFVDPFGMAINWETLETCKGLGIDIWILVPTGVAINRLLTRDGNISPPWLKKLEKFLGLPCEQIKASFYKTDTKLTLFGLEEQVTKEEKAVDKIAELYRQRLNTIWAHVSKAFVMKNSTGSIIYHFIMATNNKAGLKIANDIIGKELNKI
jgi:three-Cys-motif partner protein